MGGLKINKNSTIDTNLAEILVMTLQQFKGHPFEKLIEVSRPITLNVISHYYFKSYEREDLMQVANVVLLDAVKSYNIKEGLSFLQYYHRMLTNKMNMMVRREMATKRTIDTQSASLEEVIEKAGDFVHGESCIMTYPEEVVIVNETYNKYLVQLSPYEKHVFDLYMNGVAPKNIARKLECEEIKVRNALYRCSIKFKSTMNDGKK